MKSVIYHSNQNERIYLRSKGKMAAILSFLHSTPSLFVLLISDQKLQRSIGSLLCISPSFFSLILRPSSPLFIYFLPCERFVNIPQNTAHFDFLQFLLILTSYPRFILRITKFYTVQ